VLRAKRERGHDAAIVDGLIGCGVQLAFERAQALFIEFRLQPGDLELRFQARGLGFGFETCELGFDGFTGWRGWRRLVGYRCEVPPGTRRTTLPQEPNTSSCPRSHHLV
jgi:hypothetical protein